MIKNHVEPHFNHLDLGKGMVPLTVPLASHGTSADTIGVIWLPYIFWLSWHKVCHWQWWWYHVMPTLAPMASHDQKGHTAPNFDHTALRNGMLPLIMQFILHSTNAIANATTSPKLSYCPLSQLSWPKECNGALMIPLASHDQKCHVVPHFNDLDIRNAMVLLTKLSASCDASASARNNGVA